MNTAYPNGKAVTRDQARAMPVSYVRYTPALVQNLPAGVYKLALAFWGLFLATFIVTFWGSSHALFVLAICTFYAAMFFGVPYVLWRQAKKAKLTEQPKALALGDFLRRDFATADGSTNGLDALVQVILVPSILSLGCIAIGTIISLARAGAY